ncbi:MAG: alkaline phosphatase family protein [Caulobacter sp.]|nr:alkaline phosphatase family protein [Caulobacter sp.]
MNRRELALFAGAAVAAARVGRAGAAPSTAGSLPEPPAMPSAPLDEARVLTRVGFGSCYVPQFEKAGVWTAIRATAPDAFLYIGDNVYQSEENGRPELIELREAYAALAADAPFAALRATTPVLVTWDDHDYGMNDAGAEFPARLQSEALFKRVWAIPAEDPRSSRPGVYHRPAAGPPGRRTQLIVLDTRYFRTSETMLGATQWQWLEETLSEPADLRVLASSIPVLSEVAVGECWSRWPAEQDRLLALIGRTAASGVVIVSGDSHFGAVYRREDGAPYPLTEMTSSSLNFPMPETARTPPGPVDARRLGAAFYPANFGSVAIDWQAGAVDMVLHDDAGAVVRTERVTLATLRA